MKEKLKIYSNIQVEDQTQLFKFISEQAQTQGIVSNAKDFNDALWQRESFGTTGLENHIAIPHAISDKILSQFVFVVCLKKAIKYPSLDNTDVKSAICFAVPKAQQDKHLGVLQQVSIMLLDKKNQDLLNSGDVKTIAALFSDVKKKLETNTAPSASSKQTQTKSVTKSVTKPVVDTASDIIEDDEEVVQPVVKNLITIKKELLTANKTGANSNTQKQLNEINQQIDETKKTIVNLRKGLKNTTVTSKTKFKTELENIKAKIAVEKPISKAAMNEFNTKDKAEIDAIKNRESDPIKQRELLGKHYSATYQDKIKITEKLTMLMTQKENLISDYKTNKKSTHTDFTNQMDYNKHQIVNPKNFMYKHANKFQFWLMLLLSIIGLWCIVLGSFGITNFGSFISINTSQVHDVLKQIYATDTQLQTILDAYDAWSQMTIQSSQFGVSMAALILGIIAIVMIVPLKIFKVSNVNKELYGFISAAIGVALLISTIILMAISFENIQLYKAVTIITGKSKTEGFNDQLKAYWDLKDAFKTKDSFASINDWNSYETNMKALLSTWGFDASGGLTEKLRNEALTKITGVIKDSMNSHIIPTVATTNFDAITIGASLFIHI